MSQSYASKVTDVIYRTVLFCLLNVSVIRVALKMGVYMVITIGVPSNNILYGIIVVI